MKSVGVQKLWQVARCGRMNAPTRVIISFVLDPFSVTS